MSEAMQPTAQQDAVAVNESDPRTMIAAVHARLAAVRELLKTELKGPTAKNPDGTDYGVIPGTKKLTLYQPGAEKIALMFQFVPGYQVTKTELPGGHLEASAICTLTHNGRIVGQAEGSASTRESKHRYRGASGKTCPTCGASACLPSKKEFGGGYYCAAKNGGCGETFKAGTPEAAALDLLPAIKAENMDPADQRNTVVKIAQKRAYVSAVKTASAASEIFTVDMEDVPRADNGEQKPPVAMPTAKPAANPTPAPAGNSTSPAGQPPSTATPPPAATEPPPATQLARGKVDRAGAKGKRSWVKIGGDFYSTYHEALGARVAMLQPGDQIELAYRLTGRGDRDIVELTAVDGGTDKANSDIDDIGF